MAVVAGETSAVLAGAEILEAVDDRIAVVGRVLLGIRPDGSQLGELEAVALLRQATLAGRAADLTRTERGAALRLAAQAVRALVRQHEAAAWWRRSDPTTRSLLERLFQLARAAGRARERSSLGSIERAIRFVGGGHTAGERQLLRDIAVLPTPALLASLPALPSPSAHGAGLLTARLTGLIVIRDTTRSAHVPAPA